MTDCHTENDHWRHLDRMLVFIRGRTYPSYEFGTQPTVREMARRYRVRQQDIVDMLECHDSVCMNVAVGIGDGFYEHESIGDYNFEWTGD